jgi:hypothetical protein
VSTVLELHQVEVAPFRKGAPVYVPAGKIIRFVRVAPGPRVTPGCAPRPDGSYGAAVYLAGMYDRPFNHRTGEKPTHSFIHVWEACEEIADMLDPRRAFAKRPDIDKATPAFTLDNGRDLLDG